MGVARQEALVQGVVAIGIFNFHVGFRFSLALTVLQTKQRCKWQRKGEGKSTHSWK